MPALVTGRLSTFGWSPSRLPGVRLWFVPSSPGMQGPYILPSQPVEATMLGDSSGSFSVYLVDTQTVRPAAWYTLRIEWLDPVGNFTSVDYPDWRVFVPPEGGSLSDLIRSPWNPTLAWWESSVPPGDPVYSTLWLDPETASLKIWS